MTPKHITAEVLFALSANLIGVEAVALGALRRGKSCLLI